MKKIQMFHSTSFFVVLLILMVALSFCSCGKNNQNDPTTDSTTESVSLDAENSITGEGLKNGDDTAGDYDSESEEKEFFGIPDISNPVVYSAEEQKQVADFQTIADGLPMDDIPSALELLRTFKALASDVHTNDALFLEYEEAMQSISESLNSSMEGELPDESTIMDAIENGFLLVEEDEFPHFILRPDFFCDTFSSYVSGPIQAMLELRKKHYYFADEHDFIENTTLMVTLDQLAEMIVDWENYLNHYSDFIDITPVAYNLDYYLKIYIGSNQIENSGYYLDMGVDQNGNQVLKLADEPKESYRKFIENYSDSICNPIISELYQIYEENNFLYTVDIESFFIKKGLDVPYYTQ